MGALGQAIAGMRLRGALAAVAGAIALLAGGPISSASAKLELTIVSPRDGSSIRDTTPTFTGTTTDPFDETVEAFDPVTLNIYDGNGTAGTRVEGPLTTAEGPTWSIGPVSALPPGTYTAVAEQNDTLTNEQAESAPVTFTIDTTPPQIAIGAPPSGSTSTGASEVVSGTAGTAPGDLAGVNVELFAGAAIGTQAALETLTVQSTAGAWSATFGGLKPGTYTARATQSDSAGNKGVSAPTTFTLLAPPSQGPLASFTWFPSAPHVGEPVTLVSTSTDALAPLTSFAWDTAGSGQFKAAGATVTTSFSTPGTHVVGLRIGDAGGQSSATSQKIQVGPRQLVLMQPFPVVRIVGRVTASGVQLTLLSVQAPVGARITVSCRGAGCPTRRQTRTAHAGRRRHRRAGATTVVFPRFARGLAAGTILEVRVSKAGEIGKYTRFAIRRHNLPTRFDGCVGPASPRPISCP
jgi:hypothetical protein